MTDTLIVTPSNDLIVFMGRVVWLHSVDWQLWASLTGPVSTIYERGCWSALGNVSLMRVDDAAIKRGPRRRKN
jgi:hypothetical protein